MAKVWFYGDSFTAGSGLCFKEYLDKTSTNYIENLNLNNEYHWDKVDYLTKFKSWKNTYENHIFPNHFSNSLKLDFINRGEGGASNDRIIHKIFSDLKNFESKDIIVIGMTAYARVLVPSNEKNKLMQHAGSDDSFTFIQGGINKGSWSIEKSIINFCHDVLVKNDEAVFQYYTKLFESIRTSLLSKVKDVMIWDYYHWGYFDQIKEWSKGSVEDNHWSPGGHKEFADYLLKNYFENKHILFKQKPLI